MVGQRTNGSTRDNVSGEVYGNTGAFAKQSRHPSEVWHVIRRRHAVRRKSVKELALTATAASWQLLAGCIHSWPGNLVNTALTRALHREIGPSGCRTNGCGDTQHERGFKALSYKNKHPKRFRTPSHYQLTSTTNNQGTRRDPLTCPGDLSALGEGRPRAQPNISISCRTRSSLSCHLTNSHRVKRSRLVCTSSHDMQRHSTPLLCHAHQGAQMRNLVVGTRYTQTVPIWPLLRSPWTLDLVNERTTERGRAYVRLCVLVEPSMAELEFLDPRDELILFPRHLLQEILNAEHTHHLRRKYSKHRPRQHAHASGEAMPLNHGGQGGGKPCGVAGYATCRSRRPPNATSP